MDPFLLLLLVFLVVMIFMSSRARKQQAKQRQELESGLRPGAGVMTVGGFYGRVVDIDGDVVTLESPSGVETIWSKTAIRQITEPPFAPVEETSEDASDIGATTPGATDVSSTDLGASGTGGATGTGDIRGTDEDEPGTDRPRA